MDQAMREFVSNISKFSNYLHYCIKNALSNVTNVTNVDNRCLINCACRLNIKHEIY